MGKLGLSIAAVAIGIVLIVAAAIVGWVVVPNVIDNKVKEETRLINGSDTWEKWQDVKYPIQLRFYIFNITNPEALGTDEKLVFEEKGPYVYDQTRVKVDIIIDEEEDTVSYREVKHYFFNDQDSGGSQDDLFNIPNVPFISVAHNVMATKTGFQLTLGKALVNAISSGSPTAGVPGDQLIAQGVSVREMLFEGWQLSPLYTNIPPADFPEDFEGLRFGFYRNKNGSDDGEYVVKSGRGDDTEFGKVVEWDGMKELPWWYTEGLDLNSTKHYCNKINGSDGSIYPPFVSKDTTLRIFNTDVCRSIFLTYDSEETVYDIPAYKFTIPFEMFENPATNPDNQCFCPAQSENVTHQCGQSLIRIFGCKGGAPIITSNAHFLDGGQELFEPIQIEPPQREQHETFIIVEPTSGSLLEASKKIQIGVEVQKFDGIRSFQNLDQYFSKFTESPSVVLPIFWAEEYVQVTEEDADDLYGRLIKPQKIVNIVKYAVLGLGAVVTLVGGVMFMKR